MEGSNSDQGIT